MTFIAKESLLLRETGTPAGIPALSRHGGPVLAGQGYAGDLDIEYVADIATLAAIREDWSALAERALQANITMVPAKALAAIRHLQDGGHGSAVLVWQDGGGEAASRQLVGIFALQNSQYRWGIPVDVAIFWNHLYSLGCTPLVDRVLAGKVIEVFVNWLGTDKNAPRFLSFSQLIKGPVHDLLVRVMQAQGMRVRGYNSHVRAMLETDAGGEEYLRQSLGKKRAKEYRRLRNRLSDNGAVEFRICREVPDIAAAAGRFLELEMAGWKGERGTALACRADWKSFIEDTISGLADSGHCRFAELTLDGTLIATTLVVTSQKTAWMWKIAYDESLARYSPGVLLVLEVTKTLIEDEGIERVDSCALPDHPMINSIWRERLGVTDLLVTTRGGLVPGRLIELLETLRREARSKLKILYKKLVKETHRG